VERLSPGRLAIVALALAGVVSLYRLELLDPGVVGPASSNLRDFAADMFPPDLDVLPTLSRAMVETIEIAFVGTLLGFLVALPLSALATSSLFGPLPTSAARFIIGSVRTVPSLLWAVIFVVGFGLGPAAGALGVAMYSVGYLGKLLYEQFDGVDREVLEAVRSVGANRMQLFSYAVLPESANGVISQLLFMFEYNIRASSIMGFVGAGGIGFYMSGYLQLLQYERLLTALLVTFVVVMTIDYASRWLRAQLQAPSVPHRAPLLAGVVP